jgi:hypothetical protein
VAGESPEGLLQYMQQEDKAQHIICGFMAVVALLPLLGLALAVVLVLVLGLLKEIWDLAVGSGFSWYDIVANLVGVTLALVVLLIGTL